MYMELKITVNGEEYLLKGDAIKVSYIEEQYKHKAKSLKKIIKAIEEPKTLHKIALRATEGEGISIRMVRKILAIYEGKLWCSSLYQNPNGGKATTQYELIKKKDIK